MESDVTTLLNRLSQGDRAAFDTLVPVIYAELRRVARRYMSHERVEHTLQTTALVHEAYLRLVGSREPRWEDRSHFVRVAARAMRNVLIDHARERGRLKRGGGAQRLPLDLVLDEAGTFFGMPDLDVLALSGALDRLAAEYPRQAQVVELSFFAGLSHPETAEALQVSRATVDRDWSFARVWLIRELEGPRGSRGSARS